MISVTNVSVTSGTNATLTAIVSGSGPVPTGDVAFQVASGSAVTTTCTSGSNDETCTANYPTSGLMAGPNAIVASYPGDSNYNAAIGKGTLTVTGITTSSITSSLNPSNFGVAVILTATVASISGAPDGTVTF